MGSSSRTCDGDTITWVGHKKNVLSITRAPTSKATSTRLERTRLRRSMLLRQRRCRRLEDPRMIFCVNSSPCVREIISSAPSRRCLAITQNRLTWGCWVEAFWGRCTHLRTKDAGRRRTLTKHSPPSCCPSGCGISRLRRRFSQGRSHRPTDSQSGVMTS